MSRRSRLLVPGVMTALLVAASAFAILAGKGSSSGGSAGARSASEAASSSTAVGTGATPTGTAPSGFDGAALPLGVPAPNFTLTDQHGTLVSLASLARRPVVLAFLYSTCGGSCVVIAQQIRGALDELRAGVSVLIVSADPHADSRRSVEAFLAQVSLAGRARWLSGSPAVLRAVWRDYHVTPASAGRAAFARAATVVLVGPEQDQRVLYGPEQLTPEALAHDIGRLQRSRRLPGG
jgi:protein SCO1/2